MTLQCWRRLGSAVDYVVKEVKGNLQFSAILSLHQIDYLGVFRIEVSSWYCCCIGVKTYSSFLNSCRRCWSCPICSSQFQRFSFPTTFSLLHIVDFVSRPWTGAGCFVDLSVLEGFCCSHCPMDSRGLVFRICRTSLFSLYILSLSGQVYRECIHLFQPVLLKSQPLCFSQNVYQKVG